VKTSGDGSRSNPVKQKPLLVESIRGRSAVTPANFIFISMTMDNGNGIFLLETSKLWEISIVAWSNATNTDWKFSSEGRYPFPSYDHVHRCSLNGGVEVVKVAENIREVCQGNNELILKVLCYATTSVYQKLLNFFAQLKNTSKHSTTGYPSHFCLVKKNRTLCWALTSLQKLWTDSDSRLDFWWSLLHSTIDNTF